jgi:hypothetical protein
MMKSRKARFSITMDAEIRRKLSELAEVNGLNFSLLLELIARKELNRSDSLPGLILLTHPTPEDAPSEESDAAIPKAARQRQPE